jgi:pyruvate dehydrogenase E2 component (dihydrolipoamide acetyltransferase)
MPHEVVVPRLGLTMEEGRVADWHKQDGETVEPGEALFSVETDKAVMEVQAEVGGVVCHAPDLSPGALPIGTVIGYILQPGEEAPGLESADAGRPAPDAAPSDVPAITPGEVQDETGSSTDAAVRNAPPAAPARDAADRKAASTAGKLSSPAARRRARELGVDWQAVERPGGGPVLEAHVEQAARSSRRVGRIKASPAVRRMAQEAGVDLGKLAARRPGGAIRAEDVTAVAAGEGTSLASPDVAAASVAGAPPPA